MSDSNLTIELDHVTFQLKERMSFDWLHAFGEVFCVFDQQDSGNICFGVRKEGKHLFVKYAGAKTVEYCGEPQGAVKRLKKAAALYEELHHPNLIQLIDHFDVTNGYALIFEWFDGECLHPHWSFPPPSKYTHPDSPFYRYKQLPISDRLVSMDKVVEFHRHVEQKNYVAVDFYDGSILYDFKSNTTKICDIDLYEKKPFTNTMGRLWGSSRFMSPEEFQLGAAIDERTNVFNLGAIAFGLLGGEVDRSYSKWEAGKDLYEVVGKAVEHNRDKRYSSVAQFHSAWSIARQSL